MTTTTHEPTRDDIQRAEHQRQADSQLEGLANLGAILASRTYGEPDTYREDEIDQLAQQEQESLLSLEVQRTIRLVLCTGGPHCEIQWPEGQDPTIVCYGWFGRGRYERPLTTEEEAGLQHAHGSWSDLAYALGITTE